MQVQVTRQFLNERTLVTEGMIIDVSESRAAALMRNRLVTTDIVRDLVHYQPPDSVAPLTAKTLPPLYIAVPAWGEYYVDLACRFTVPAILASLARSHFRDVNFLIHTDDEASFRRAIGDCKTRFMPLMPMSKRPDNPKMERLPDNFWVAFKQAHKDAIAATPHGAITVLLNSDVVMSRECFPYVERQMIAGKKVVASVGIRTQIEDNPGPPIGASAGELFRWIWGHRHHITDECIWGKGRSHHPTILFFEDGENVGMRGFHLCPMVLRRDRPLLFKGTIDDDLLGRFREEEIAYPTAGEVAFAEISPNWKTHPAGGKLLNVDDVLEFWGRRMVRPHYLRNFEQSMTVLGKPVKHPAIDQIIARLSEYVK